MSVINNLAQRIKKNPEEYAVLLTELRKVTNKRLEENERLLTMIEKMSALLSEQEERLKEAREILDFYKARRLH